MTRPTFRQMRLILLAASLAAITLMPAQAQADPDRWTKRVVVQPGGAVYAPDRDIYCTMGFLFRDPSGVVYGVTGGDCAPNGQFRDGAGTYTPYEGSRTWPVGKGPVVGRSEPRHRPYGRFVAQVLSSKEFDISYALVRLDRGMSYDAKVAVSGGPRRRPYSGQTSEPTQISYVCLDGYTIVYPADGYGYVDGAHDDVAPLGVTIPSFVLTEPANGNCSGAPIVGFDGTAVAIHSGHLGSGGYSTLEGHIPGGPPAYRIVSIIDSAQRQLHTTLTLLQSGEKGVTRR